MTDTKCNQCSHMNVCKIAEQYIRTYGKIVDALETDAMLAIRRELPEGIVIRISCIYWNGI